MEAKSLKLSLKPVEAADCCFLDSRQFGDIPVNSNNIWKTGTYGGYGAIALCALTVHDIWSDLLKFAPNSSDAAKIARLHPADVRNMETMVVNIFGQLFR